MWQQHRPVFHDGAQDLVSGPDLGRHCDPRELTVGNTWRIAARRGDLGRRCYDGQVGRYWGGSSEPPGALGVDSS